MRLFLAHGRRLRRGQVVHVALALVSFFIALVLIALKPLWWVRIARFGGFLSGRIGHLAANPDVYLRTRGAGIEPQQTIDFFYVSPQGVANRQLLTMWLRSGHFKLLPTRLGESLIDVLQAVPGGQRHIFSTHPTGPRTLPPAQSAYLAFTPEELQRGQKVTEAMGIPAGAPIVCVHHREAAYLQKHQGHDANVHDYRDSALRDYLPMMEALAARGYYVLRMGSVTAEHLPVLGARIIDYATAWRSDFMDVYLSQACRFFVGANSGLSALNIIWRKPQVFVNYIPFQAQDLSAWSAGSLFVPKKLWHTRERRFLTVAEMAQLVVDIHYPGDFFADHELEPRNTEPREIVAAALEMDHQLRAVRSDSPGDELQRRFWAHFTSPALWHSYHMTISESWLKEHEHLL